MMRAFKRFYDEYDAVFSSQNSTPLPNLCPESPFERPSVFIAPIARPSGLPADLPTDLPTKLRPDLSTASPVAPLADVPDAQTAQKHLSAALDHISDLEIQLKERSAALDESRTEVATIAIMYHRLALELQEKCRELDAANEAIFATKAVFSKAVESCAELSAQIHGLEGNLNAAAKTIKVLQTEIEDLKTVSAVAKEQNDTLARSLEKSEQQHREKLAARTAQLEVQISQKKAEFLEQHLNFSALESALASKNYEIERAQLEIERLKALSTSAQEENGKLTKPKDETIARLESELQTERSRNSGAQELSEELRRELMMLLPKISGRPILISSTENQRPRHRDIAA